MNWINVLENWNNPAGRARMDLVFENRNLGYGAYAIRLHYNRNKVWAMLTAPVLVALVMLSAMHTAAADQTPAEDTPITRFALDTFYLDTESPEEPKTVANEGKTDEQSEVPEIDHKSPWRKQTIGPGYNDMDGFPGTGSGIGSGRQKGGQDGAGDGPQAADSSRFRKGALLTPGREAEFVGGDAAFARFVQDHFVVPETCSYETVTGGPGEVKIMFIVAETGTLSDFRILEDRTGCPGMTEEAIRVMKQSPRWIPAIHGGRFVKAWRIATVRLQY